MILKPVGQEEAVNATPKTFGNSTLVRVLNTATATRLLTIKDVHSYVTVFVNTDVNATTLFVLSSGNTNKMKVLDLLVNSDNTAVVNTDTAARIDSIVNSSAFVANVDILIANGSANVGVASLVSNTTLAASSENWVYKNRSSTLHSNNNTDVLGQPCAIKGD